MGDDKKKNSRLREMLNTTDGRIKIKEERVLNYLLENEDRIQELSISDIADNADVSKATVVRFCKALDFNGLKDFKVWYEAGKGAKFNKVHELKGNESPSDVASLLKDGAVGTLERTLSGANIDVLSGIVENIRKNESITIVGLGEESIYANELARIIREKFPQKKIAVNGDKENPLPYCIVISLTGIDREAMTYLTNAVINEGVVTAVTANGASLIGKAASDCLTLSDEVLYGPDRHLLGKFALTAVISYIEIMLARA